MVLIIKPGREISAVEPATPPTFTLEEMQKIVGGYIELVSIPNFGEMMFVNEDGRCMQLAYNEIASELAGQPIVGPALVVRLG